MYQFYGPSSYLQECHVPAHHPEFWRLGQSMRDNFVRGGGGGDPIRAYISIPEPVSTHNDIVFY